MVSRYAALAADPALTKSRKRSSRCCATSSTRSCSAAAVKPSAARRRCTALRKSGMFNPRNSADGGNKILPALLLGAQHGAAFGSQRVISPPALLRLFDPAALDPFVLFQTVEQG